jgi:hypothetical protein
VVDPEAEAVAYPTNPTRARQFHPPTYRLAQVHPCVGVDQSKLTFKMVYYFTSNTTTPSAFIYVGKDKVESENQSICAQLHS